MNRDIVTRLKEFMNYYSLNSLSLSKELGYNGSEKISRLFREGNAKPSFDILYDITNKFEINSDWLLTGRGNMHKDSSNKVRLTDPPQNNQKASNIPSIIDHKNRTYKSVPLLPIEAVAGFPGDDIQGITYADCDQYSVPEFDDRGYEFLIRVSGSSMYPKYSNGDILACKKIHDILFFQWGKVYVIDTSQGALVKRVFEDEDNPDNILLVSDNTEKYRPFRIPKSDIRSLSIVLGVIRME